MAHARWQTARLADLERDDGWAPIRQLIGVTSFGINAWTAHEAGGRLIPDHHEEPTRHEELYVVIAGHATFTVERETLDAPAGTVVFVRDPTAVRGAVAVSAETTVLSVGGEPGEAYVPLSWETNRDVLAMFDAGRHADAKLLLTDALEQYEDRSYVLYNLACAEAKLGEIEAALEHLGSAIGQRPSFGEAAREDDDLIPLHADPRFDAMCSPRR